MNSNKIDLSDIWGEPKTYKKIKIYPILMKDIVEFYEKSYVLTIDKNKIAEEYNTPELISMSYLEFFVTQIAKVVNEKGNYLFPNALTDLLGMLKLSLKDQKVSLDINEKTMKPIVYIKTEGKIITIRSTEFDKLKNIILKQNNAYVEMPNGFAPEVKRVMEKAIDSINKKNRNKIATLEEQIATYSAIEHISFNEIKQMTIYQFDLKMKRLSYFMECLKIWIMASSGMIPSEDIPNWLDHIPDKNPYEEVLVSSNELNKFGVKK